MIKLEALQRHAQRYHPYSYDPHEAKAMQCLWANVLLQAIMDATLPDRPGVRVHNVDAATLRRSARAWLSKPSPELHFTCLMAGFDPNYVRKRVTDFLNNRDRIERMCVSFAGRRDHLRRSRRRNTDRGVVQTSNTLPGTGAGTAAHETQNQSAYR